jgi:hypothetical protein
VFAPHQCARGDWSLGIVQADHRCEDSEVDTDDKTANAIADPAPVQAAAQRVVLAPLHVDVVATAPATMRAATSRRHADKKRPHNLDGASASDALHLTQAERRAAEAARRVSRAAGPRLDVAETQ